MRDVRKMADIWPIAAQVLSAGGCFRLWPSGRSMLPLLREGRDSVLLAPPKDIRPLDILLVRAADGSFVLHRAIRVDEGGITLCGDARTACEGPFPREAVLAVVTTVYRDEEALDPRSTRAIAAARRRVRWNALRRLAKRMLGR